MIDRPLEPGKRGIIIGASSGIGASLAKELAGRGWQLAVVARREELLEALREDIDAAGNPQPLIFTHDVTQYDEAPALFQEIVRSLGGVDLLVYNAGVMPSVAANEYAFAKDKAMVDVNLLGGMAWLGQAAVRFERAQSGQIVGIGSIAGDRGRRNNPGYHASKAAFHAYLESLRNRLSQHGVTVTTIKPGMVETEMLANVEKKMMPVSAEAAAAGIARAIAGKKQTAYVPGQWRLVSLIIQHIPSFIFRRLNI